MNWIRRRLRLWLDIPDRACPHEAAVATLAEQNGKLAQALHTIVAQLNHNTLTMQRWSKESATLEAIERRHAMKVGAVSNGNGKSSVLVLPEP